MMMTYDDQPEGETSSRSVSLLGKRKSQQNPNLDVASSSSMVPVEYKRRRVVATEPVREIEPVAEQVVIGGRVFTKPGWLVNKIREVNGVDAKLIVEKQLTKTDLDSGNTRLLVPWKQIMVERFLTGQELIIIDEQFGKIRKAGVDVTLWGSHDRRSDLNLKRWDMQKTSNYVFNTGWNKAARYHRLKEGHVINLWAFRFPDGRLHFAIVNLGRLDGPKPKSLNPDLYQPLPVYAQPLALAPPPDQAVDLDAQPLALVPAPDQAPAQSLALVPAAARASSSGWVRIRVVRRNPEEQYIRGGTTLEDEEWRRRVFVDYPRRRRSLRVPVSPPVCESEEDSQSKVTKLDLMAEACENELKDTPPYSESEDESESKGTQLDLLAKLDVELLKETQDVG